MADLLSAYMATSRADVAPILQSIIDAPPFSFDRASRGTLIEALLADLKSKTRIPPKDAALALLALKTLGKIPTGSETMASPSTLSTLLQLASSFLKDDSDASSEALRCVANCLLLHPSARDNLIDKEVNGGEICAVMLDKATNQDVIFILSRILFLSTVTASPFVKSLVNEKRHGKNIVDIIGAKLDAVLVGILSGQKMAREAMTDLLKFTFNILLHYPKMVESEPQNSNTSDDNKVIGDFWSSNLDGLLAPTLRVFHSLPPTFPSPLVSPLTHVIHALITIPIKPSNHSTWFPKRSNSAKSSKSSSPSSSPPTTHSHVSSSSTSRSESPTSSSTPSAKPIKGLDRALSVISRSISRSPSPNPPASRIDTFLHVHDLLEVAFGHYFPDAIEPDDVSIRENLKKELALTSGITDTTLDDVLTPLVVLMTRFCVADETCRSRARQWLVPPDLDRSTPLEGRPDMLGRCLRLLSSVYHARLKDATGELLFAISDSDPTMLSALFGYGNVAGFLFNKGIMSAPGPSSEAGIIPEGVNPITGTTVQEKKSSEPELTQEEKEQEMEKLFVLFDRLEKTGALPPDQNPIRKGLQKAAMQG
ncbi:guanine nucleotide exchange factor [Mycena floridula]|nr:guanine nucleotide exchange factor [Mycena floridula]